MVNNKKAQSALEFLMTYGWAFLIILIMIGALAYFGVLNPDRLLPDRTTFSPPVQVKRGEYVINNADSGTVVMNLINSFGSNIIVNGASATVDYAGGCTAPTINLHNSTGHPFDVGTTEFIWKDGQQARLNISCGGGDTLPEGSKVKFAVNLNWYPGGSSASFGKTAQGELTATVQ